MPWGTHATCVGERDFYGIISVDAQSDKDAELRDAEEIPELLQLHAIPDDLIPDWSRSSFPRVVCADSGSCGRCGGVVRALLRGGAVTLMPHST